LKLKHSIIYISIKERKDGEGGGRVGRGGIIIKCYCFGF
jgi:hypothetical protein